MLETRIHTITVIRGFLLHPPVPPARSVRPARHPGDRAARRRPAHAPRRPGPRAVTPPIRPAHAGRATRESVPANGTAANAHTGRRNERLARKGPALSAPGSKLSRHGDGTDGDRPRPRPGARGPPGRRGAALAPGTAGHRGAVRPRQPAVGVRALRSRQPAVRHRPGPPGDRALPGRVLDPGPPGPRDAQGPHHLPAQPGHGAGRGRAPGGGRGRAPAQPAGTALLLRPRAPRLRLRPGDARRAAARPR